MTTWQRILRILVWIGGIFAAVIVVSMLVGSGFCAGAQRHMDRTTFVNSGRSIADIHVDAAPGASVDATVHIGSNRSTASPTTDGAYLPAWIVFNEPCVARFVDCGQVPGSWCNRLPRRAAGQSAKPPSAKPPADPCAK